ncbi:MAG: glycerol-3-phosphate 1-O-acyltransferase PlsY [Acidimicrobiia bacterium]
MSNPTVIVALLVPAAYLLGTFPSAELVARRRGRDVRSEGSGNPGASNVARLIGWKAFLLVVVLDAAKGAIAAGVGLAVDGRPGAYILGVAALLGHMLPVWSRFKGGKGVATGAGVMLVLFPIITLALAVVWFVLTKVVRKASVASLVVAIAYPVWAVVTGCAWWEIAVLAVLAALVIVRHWRNVRRLVRGEELDLTLGTPQQGAA